MLALALETSHLPGSIALMEDTRVLGEAELPTGNKTAQSLVPAIGELLASAGMKPRDVTLVAVSHGPGSFTGLRLGVTCAKTFAYAAGAEGMGIDTLRVCAAQACESSGGEDEKEERLVEAVANAQRGELFVARYRCVGELVEPVEEPQIVKIEAWLESLVEGVRYTGPGLAKLKEPLPTEIQVAPEKAWMPRAVTVARLALADYAAGVRHEVLGLGPQYFRASYAEEKRA